MNQDNDPMPGLPLPDDSLRLLPWATPDGKPCFLRTDDTTSVLSRLADLLETAQTTSGTEVLAGAKAVLADRTAGSRELRFALVRMTEALADVLRVAESRAGRLPPPAPDRNDGPELPAEAFG
ncbi:hypothetical protein [Streptomyces sp. NPDC095613]|uniref:hypothetical protein n=1 Tax=Streptomyces sp. NPDC095613 TaxID=3155540 RepID=UPI00332FAB40